VTVTRTLRLSYIPTTPPRRHPSVRTRYELKCEPRGTRWSIRAPGNWVERGEVFEPEPAFIHTWLGEAVAPFGGVPGDAEYLVPSEERLDAFITSLQPLLGTDDLSLLITTFPNDPELLIARAMSPERAEAERENDVSAALAIRADAAALLAASWVFAPRDRPRAIELLLRAIEQDAENQDVLSALATVCELDGRVRDALTFEERLATKRPREASGWIVRAGMLAKLGLVEEELDAVTQSLALHENASWRVRRGKLLARLGRDGDALRELDAALPGCADLDGHLLRAELLARKGDLDGAEKVLRWVALAPSHRAPAEARLRELKLD
jgi:tetratricopeptide (TPR) repeat protein